MEAKVTWIPVEKEVPDDDIEVLVWTSDEYFYLAHRSCAGWYDNLDMPVGNVTHWAHLPEVPK